MIPEFSSNKTPATLTALDSVEGFDKIRQATTDKLFLTLIHAEWDSPSQHLRSMVSEMPLNFL